MLGPPRCAFDSVQTQSRRGQNVDIRIPLFEDQNTPEFRGQEVEEKRPEETAPVERNRTSVHGEAESNTRLRSVNETGPVESSPQVATGKKTFARPDVHMDAMAFGMGCCCLQVTFQVSLLSSQPWRRSSACVWRFLPLHIPHGGEQVR